MEVSSKITTKENFFKELCYNIDMKITIALLFLTTGLIQAQDHKKRDFVPIPPISSEPVAKPKPQVWYGPDGEVLPERDPNRDNEPEGTLFPMVPLNFD